MSQKTTAISIADNMKKLLALVENGEFTMEDIADTLEGEELALSDKLDGIMSLVRHIDGQSSVVDGEIARLSTRKKSFDGESKRLKAYVLSCLQAAEKKSLKTEFNTFSVRKGSVSVVIDNEQLLPDELVDVTTIIAPDKKKIKEAIEAGKKVEGAHLETGAESLQVR